VAGMPSHATGDGELPRGAVRDGGGETPRGQLPQRGAAVAGTVEFEGLWRRPRTPRYRRRNWGDCGASWRQGRARGQGDRGDTATPPGATGGREGGPQRG